MFHSDAPTGIRFIHRHLRQKAHIYLLLPCMELMCILCDIFPVFRLSESLPQLGIETLQDAQAERRSRKRQIGACVYRDGDERGAVFCIVCAWFLGSQEEALKGTGSQLPGLFIPTLNPSFFVPSSTTPMPGDTRSGGWVMACDWCTLRRTKPPGFVINVY